LRQTAPWLVAGAGALLVAVGVVLAVRGSGDAGGLVFLSPEQFAVLRAARRWAGAGRALLVVGMALLGVLGGWLMAHRRSSARRRGVAAAVAVGVLGIGLLGAGVLLLQAAGRVQVTAYSGSYEPAGCPGWTDCAEPFGSAGLHGVRWVGLGSALAGGLALGVSGGVTRGNRHADLG
jgi:hypothetical protein